MFAPEHDALADIEILYAGVCLYVRQRWLHVSYGASLRHSMVVAWLKGIEECWNKAQQQHDFFLEAHIDDNGGVQDKKRKLADLPLSRHPIPH